MSDPHYYTVGELVKDLLSEDAGLATPIKFFSSPSQEWVLLSVYKADGTLFFDIRKK